MPVICPPTVGAGHANRDAKQPMNLAAQKK
jgi:hypothetical protein